MFVQYVLHDYLKAALSREIECKLQQFGLCTVRYVTCECLRLFVSAPQKRYQALYSYMAAEADEVSLAEGDLILDVETIDEGWMFGCNQRTGQRGLLPANYVRPV